MIQSQLLTFLSNYYLLLNQFSMPSSGLLTISKTLYERFMTLLTGMIMIGCFIQ